MDWTTLFSHLPTAALIGWLLSIGIPYASAAATKHPGHLTGVFTAILSLVDGLLVQLSQQGSGNYNFGAAAGQAFLAWLTATSWHRQVLSATHTEGKLHQFPRLRLTTEPEQKAAA